jgi:glycosidase
MLIIRLVKQICSSHIRSALLVVLMLTGISLQAHAAYEIKHLEPAFWWVGMQETGLQLMLHGDNIAELEPSLAYPGVTLLATEKVENPNYLFINLQLAADLKPGEFSLILSKAGKLVANYPYKILARQKGSAQRQGFSAEDVIYLITPDRFANGDASNDQLDSLQEGPNRSFKGGRHGGDIQGVIDHLPYLADMGFTQLWLQPVLQNDQANYSYHGYSITDFYQVDKRFGSNELYKTLREKAGEKGLGLIMDMVLNHIGSEHWWMQDLPSKDWINNGGEFTPTSHRREALHDPHGTAQDLQQFASGWFVPTMPDLNQRNPLLAKYLIQNAIWWVEYAGLSGIRVDTYSYSDKDFLAHWSLHLMQEYPQLNIVGEEWTTNPAMVAYWQSGTKRHDDYVSSLPSVMDFPLQNALVSSLKEGETWATGLRKLYETIASDFLYGDPGNLVVFPDNHDMSRIYTQLDEDDALYKIALSYFLTTRGIPQIFYGTEILMANPGTDDHGIIRTDFPGGWPGDVQNAFTGKGLSDKQLNAQNHLKQLLNWRKSSDAIKFGKLTHYAPEKGTYVYFRHWQDNVVMVAINKNSQTTELELARFSQFLSAKDKAQDVMSGELINLDKSINLAPRSVIILDIK